MSQSPPLESCENCQQPIGTLETPMIWQDKIVCAACHKRLSVTNPPAPQAIELQPAFEQVGAARGVARENTPFPASIAARKNKRRTYIQRVGGRSFTFQMILAGWTVLMWGLTAVLFISTMMASRQLTDAEWAAMTPDQKVEWSVRNVDRIKEPDAAKAGDAMARMLAFGCPLSAWFIVAVPLLIAAIATAGKRTRAE